MLALLRTFSWQQLRHHPWRNAVAAVAAMLGVALAFSVQLINASALDEFSSAVRSVNGQPDLELRAVQGGFDEALFAQVATHPQVTLASPVLEAQTIAVATGSGTIALVLIAAGAARALAPAVFGMPIAAYLSVGLLLVGGITALPSLIALLYDRLAARAAAAGGGALAAHAQHGGGGSERSGREPGAGGDGGELSRVGDALARRGAAG